MTKIYYFFALLVDLTIKIILGHRSMLQGGNFILRREALEKIGGFDTSIEFYGEDSDIGKRVGQVGKIKWTFKLPIYSSGRRLLEEGIVTTGLHYTINFFGIIFVVFRRWCYNR